MWKMAALISRTKRLTKLIEQYKCHTYRNSSLSAEAAVADDYKLPRFRTLENDPLCHTEEHVGKYYTIQKDVIDKLCLCGGITRSLELQMKTFNESCIMVRKPALEIMSCLKNIDYSLPPVRFLVYGKDGVGKTCTLFHIVHFAYRSKYILLHVPWVSNWTKRPKEVVVSQLYPNMLDLPVESVMWLQHFKLQNSELLQELNLLTTQSYSWTKREVTEEGKPITDIIAHGIERMPHASDCVAALLKEIKHHSKSGKFKTLVVVDGVNAFYSKTNVRKADKTTAKATDVTIVQAFENMLKTDWTNAAIVVSVDSVIATRNVKADTPFTPFTLLGKEGFEVLEPFIPILVESYTNKEIESNLDYFVDRLWIQNEEACTEEGRTQLKFLSGNNPYALRKLCDPL